MIAVKVQYTVKSEYTEENKKNIRKVMNALQANPIDGMQYASFTDEANPDTFIHINMARNDETMAQLNGVPEFLEFRKALKASGPLSPPRSTKLNLVGAGFEF